MFWGLPLGFCQGFPDISVGKESACNAGDPGSIPGSGRSTGEGIGYPPQYSWAYFVAQLVKNLPAMWETWVRSLSWEDSPREGSGYPLQYSGLENSMDCIVHGVTKSQTQLSDFHFTRFSPVLSLRPGRSFLPLLCLANCLCPARLRSVLTCLSVTLICWPGGTSGFPTPATDHTRVSWHLLAFLSCVPTPASGMWQPHPHPHPVNVRGENKVNLRYCIAEKEPEDFSCVNDLRVLWFHHTNCHGRNQDWKVENWTLPCLLIPYIYMFASAWHYSKCK